MSTISKVMSIVITTSLIGLVIKLWFLQKDHHELQLEHNRVVTELNAAKAEVEALKTTVSFKEKEAADINELLGKCYQRVVQHQKDWDDIDRIMDLKDDEESCEKEEDSDACISRKAGEAGLDFLNRQFDSVR